MKNAQQVSGPPTLKGRVNWPQLLFLFVFIDVAVILVSLAMQHTALVSLDRAIASSERFSSQQRWVANLRKTELEFNAPGNNVFETRAVGVERVKYNVAWRKLEPLMDEGRTYGIDLDPSFRRAMDQMRQAEETIFGLVEGSIQPGVEPLVRERAAAAAMALMDRHQMDAMVGLGKMDADLRQRTGALLEKQRQGVQRRQKAEWIFAFFVLVVIIRIVVFGGRLHRSSEAFQAEQRRLTEQLSRSTDELRSAKAYTENVVASLADTLLVVDPEGRIKTINPATVRLLGYAENELIGQDVGIIFAEEESIFKGTRLQKLIEAGSLRDYEMTYQTKSGEKIPVSFSGSVMYEAAPVVPAEAGNPRVHEDPRFRQDDKQRRLLGIVGVARDMRSTLTLLSDLKRSKQELDEFSKTLEKKVQERTTDLSQAQEATLNMMEDLQESKKALERSVEKEKELAAAAAAAADAERKRAAELEESYRKLKETQAMLIQAGKLTALGQLGAGVAHELNQPIAAIRGFSQLLLSQLEPESPLAPNLKVIEEQSHRMARIVDNIRSFARDTKEGREELELNQVADTALMLITAQLRGRGITVDLKLDPNLPRVFADKNQIQQTLINLLTNARDAVEEKGPGGKITVATASDENGGVEMRVSDTGVGISPEIRDRIFDPFFTTKPPGKGTGLGLSIVYGIIQNHKGEIEVESKPGEGTTFIMKLPRGARAQETGRKTAVGGSR